MDRLFSGARCPGQAAGDAIADILFGNANPSAARRSRLPLLKYAC